jgi:hypothetical protein
VLKIAAFILLALALAIGGGAASAWLALENLRGLGAIEIGPWTAFPNAGSRNADPYSAARAARRAELALGPAEGIRFIAGRDSQGVPLSGRCRYRLSGMVPQARLWTLHALGPDERPLRPYAARQPGLHSRELLRAEDGSFLIAIDRRAAPGNWLAVAEGPFLLVLTLYDTPVTGAAGLVELSLPRLVREDCDNAPAT